VFSDISKKGFCIQNVKAAKESSVSPEEQRDFKLFTWLMGVIRN
jgi:hypothetical protein